MKNNNLKKIIRMAVITAGLSTSIAQAVPWCHQGTIVQIADVTWGESSILANFSGTIPAGVMHPDMYVTFTATNDYASTFSGGGGGFGGYSVPGSGQVRVNAYAPHNYITAPSLYGTSQGVKFKLNKCYTIPPLTQHHELREISLPWTPGGGDNPISVEPLERLQELETYWEKSQR